MRLDEADARAAMAHLQLWRAVQFESTQPFAGDRLLRFSTTLVLPVAMTFIGVAFS